MLPVCRADNLDSIMCRLSENRESLNILRPQGLSMQHACSRTKFAHSHKKKHGGQLVENPWYTSRIQTIHFQTQPQGT
jgi:hypothetical protein